MRGPACDTRPMVSSTPEPGDWEAALITGNGRQGALCYDAAGRVLITLSHERLFLPVDGPLDPPHTAGILPELRAALLDGRYREAADRVVALAVADEPGYERLRWIDPFIGAATISFG